MTSPDASSPSHRLLQGLDQVAASASSHQVSGVKKRLRDLDLEGRLASLRGLLPDSEAGMCAVTQAAIQDVSSRMALIGSHAGPDQLARFVRTEVAATSGDLEDLLHSTLTSVRCWDVEHLPALAAHDLSSGRGGQPIGGRFRELAEHFELLAGQSKPPGPPAKRALVVRHAGQLATSLQVAAREVEALVAEAREGLRSVRDRIRRVASSVLEGLEGNEVIRIAAHLASDPAALNELLWALSPDRRSDLVRRLAFEQDALPELIAHGLEVGRKDSNLKAPLALCPGLREYEGSAVGGADGSSRPSVLRDVDEPVGDPPPALADRDVVLTMLDLFWRDPVRFGNCALSLVSTPERIRVSASLLAPFAPGRESQVKPRDSELHQALRDTVPRLPDELARRAPEKLSIYQHFADEPLQREDVVTDPTTRDFVTVRDWVGGHLEPGHIRAMFEALEASLRETADPSHGQIREEDWDQAFALARLALDPVERRGANYPGWHAPELRVVPSATRFLVAAMATVTALERQGSRLPLPFEWMASDSEAIELAEACVAEGVRLCPDTRVSEADVAVLLQSPGRELRAFTIEHLVPLTDVRDRGNGRSAPGEPCRREAPHRGR